MVDRHGPPTDPQFRRPRRRRRATRTALIISFGRYWPTLLADNSSPPLDHVCTSTGRSDRSIIRGMDWDVELAGRDVDFELLCRLFPSGDPCITRDDQGCWLASSLASDSSGASEAISRTRRQLVRLNGVACAIRPAHHAVEPSGRCRDERGELSIRVVTSLPIHGLFPIRLWDEAGRTLPEWASDYLDLAKTQQDIDDVLRLMGSEAILSWSDLFKIYEIICHSVGGESILRKESWVGRAGLSRGTLRAFTTAANRPSVEDGTRHARRKGNAPKVGMSLPEGRGAIARLVRGWLDHHVPRQESNH